MNSKSRCGSSERVGASLPLIALLAGWTSAQTTTRESVSTAGVQGNEISNYPAISGDGLHIAFHSTATNFVVGDTNNTIDVFVRDRTAGTTVRISVSSSGQQGNNASNRPAISSDGRFVSFASLATNFDFVSSVSVFDTFVHDRQTGTTELVSLSTSGVGGNGHSEFSSVSGDGRYVAFQSYSSNLVPGDTNTLADVFVRDRQLGTTERASVSSSGAQGVSYSEFPEITPDGRFVVFTSYANNLVGGDTNAYPDVFVRDRQLGLTERVSVDDSGTQGNLYSVFPDITPDGRFVAFQSNASNLVVGDSNATYDVFVRDRATSTTELVSRDSAGVQATSFSYQPKLSADGRYVAFLSYDNFLVPNDFNSHWDAFVHDRLNGATELLSVQPGGTSGNHHSYIPMLSDDARYAVFYSTATDIVPGDTNLEADVFLRDRGLLYPGAYCTAGITTHGCVASIAGAGVPSASSGSGFTISVAAIEGQKQGLIFYGVDNSGYTPAAWGAGTSYLCVKTPVQRCVAQDSGGTSNACDGSLSIDWNAFIAGNPGALGQPFVAGRHVFAQAWFRDPPAPKTTNLSNALEFSVGP